MHLLTLFGILWSLAISVGSAQEAATPTEESSPATDTATNPIALKIVQLRIDYETANKQAHDLAESLRQTPDAAKKAELRTAVQRAFTLRQSLLRAELLEMQTRLLQTQQSLDMRERIADQIVDRRVEDFLNPQLRWEGSPGSAPVERANTAIPSPANPPSPIGLGLPEVIDENAWGEPQHGLRLAIVVKSENSFWNESQEVHYVVENVSMNPIVLRGQRNDQLATLFEVRQTSQAQVQTLPCVNSGVMETSSTVELLPGQQAVVGRVWIGVVEKEADATPLGDPQLKVIDPSAWEFQNKIYVLRGSLQPDPDQPTVTIRSGQVGIAFHKPANTTDIHVLQRPKPSDRTELDGDWHLDSVTDPDGTPVQLEQRNMTIRGDVFETIYSDRREIETVDINTQVKTITRFRSGELSRYEIQGEQLTIYRQNPVVYIYHFLRSQHPFQKVVQPATEEQKLRWRSGIVEIFLEYHSAQDGNHQDPVGKGVVVSSKGIIVCQVHGIQFEKDSKSGFIARFDDGSFASLTVIEESNHGWFALQPTQSGNHHFPIATLSTNVGDQVHLWGSDASSPQQRLMVSPAKVILLDRQTAKSDGPVWQLTKPDLFGSLESCPVLSGNGELLGITLRDTGDLLLAVPVEQLKSMFPKSL